MLTAFHAALNNVAIAVPRRMNRNQSDEDRTLGLSKSGDQSCHSTDSPIGTLLQALSDVNARLMSTLSTTMYVRKRQGYRWWRHSTGSIHHTIRDGALFVGRRRFNTVQRRMCCCSEEGRSICTSSEREHHETINVCSRLKSWLSRAASNWAIPCAHNIESSSREVPFCRANNNNGAKASRQISPPGSPGDRDRLVSSIY